MTGDLINVPGPGAYNPPHSSFAPFYSGVLQSVAECCTKESCHTIRLFQVSRPFTQVCCRVLQSVAECCRVLHQGVVPSIRLFLVVCPSTLVCCSVLQCVAVCCIRMLCDTMHLFP